MEPTDGMSAGVEGRFEPPTFGGFPVINPAGEKEWQIGNPLG